MTDKNSYKIILDEIQKIVHAELKYVGFSKKGRTHNRVADKGIIQVVNFQMAKYPIGTIYDIPGLRENLYGKFTINLGVYVEELYTAFRKPELKTFVQEYHCDIRTRLSHLMLGGDEWYPLMSNYTEIAETIVNGLHNEGQNWFDRFNTRNKIVADLRNKSKIEFSPREKLSAAVIQLGIDRSDGLKIFNEYYNSISDSNPHKKWLMTLKQKLQIE